MTDPTSSAPHIALLPSSGMGHLIPSLRLAAALDRRGCNVTFITILPTVSSVESSHLSRFLSSFPRIRPLDFHLLPFDPSTAASTDPFFLQFEAIRRSLHLLPPLLSSLCTPPLSAIVTDITLVSSIVDILLPFPNYVFFSSSAAMLALCAFFPTSTTPSQELQIQGLPTIPYSDIPPLLLDPSNLFKTQFNKNGLALVKANGILINTFQALEREILTALNTGAVVPCLPKVITIGPLEPCPFERSQSKSEALSWLDALPGRSVVYVSFGSRTALSGGQIKQLADGLERSGHRFLWVVKSKKVDKVDTTAVGEVVGEEFLERVRERGLVVKDWVDQWEVLEHPAVGGFVSHCGWNSVTEAAMHGMPVLAWPQNGDQKMNARVVERSGLGIWERKWGWGDKEANVLVTGREISERIKELMTNERVRESAARVGEEARRAVVSKGTSDVAMIELLDSFKVHG